MFTNATLRAAIRGDNLIPYDDGERPAKIDYEAEIGKFDAMQHAATTDRHVIANVIDDERLGTDSHPKSPRTIDNGVADSNVASCDDLADYHDNIADDPSEHMDEFTQAILQVSPSAADLYMQANAYSLDECSLGGPTTRGHTHDRFITPTNEIPSLGAGSYGWRAPDPYNRNNVTYVSPYASPYANGKFAAQPAYPAVSTSRILDSIMDKVEFIEADLTELRETCDQTSQLCEDIDKGTATVIRQITALVSLVRTLATEMASSAESIRRIEERLNLMEAQSSSVSGPVSACVNTPAGNSINSNNGPIGA